MNFSHSSSSITGSILGSTRRASSMSSSMTSSSYSSERQNNCKGGGNVSPLMFDKGFCALKIVSSHPVVGTSDGRTHPAKAKVQATGWRGGASTRLRETCRRLARLNARFEDSLFGDVLGVITLFVVLYGLLLAVPFVDGVMN